MNVLIVTPAFPPAVNVGGAIRSAGTLAAVLVRAGASVRVVTTTCGLRSDVPRERNLDGVMVTTLRTVRGPGGGRFALAPEFPRVVRAAAGEADVAVVQGIWTFATLAGCRGCRARSLPYVLSPRGSLERVARGAKRWKKTLYFKWIESGNIRRAAAVHFTSDSERQKSEEALGGARAFVVANPVDSPPLRERGGDRLRVRLGIPHEARLLGVAGRIHPRKGYPVVFPALAADPALHLVLIGSDEEGHLRSVLSDARVHGVGGQVHALGHLDGDALQEAYASIDLLAVPSQTESFGNVVVEALAQGTEVLVSDGVALAAYVTEHGLGRVVGGVDPAAWRAALEDWTRRPRDWNGAAAARQVREDFALEPIGRQWIEEFSRII